MGEINVDAIVEGLQLLLLNLYVNDIPYDLAAVAEILYNNGYDDEWGDDDDAPGEKFHPVIPDVNLKVTPGGSGSSIAFLPNYGESWVVVTADSVKHVKREKELWL